MTAGESKPRAGETDGTRSKSGGPGDCEPGTAGRLDEAGAEACPSTLVKAGADGSSNRPANLNEALHGLLGASETCSHGCTHVVYGQWTALGLANVAGRVDAREAAACCSYRDHSGGPCACPEHVRSLLHPFGYPGPE